MCVLTFASLSLSLSVRPLSGRVAMPPTFGDRRRRAVGESERASGASSSWLGGIKSSATAQSGGPAGFISTCAAGAAECELRRARLCENARLFLIARRRPRKVCKIWAHSTQLGVISLSIMLIVIFGQF
jgi:hypothetical protein